MSVHPFHPPRLLRNPHIQSVLASHGGENMAPQDDRDARDRLIRLEERHADLKDRVSKMETKMWAVIGVVLLAVGKTFLTTIGLGQ